MTTTPPWPAFGSSRRTPPRTARGPPSCFRNEEGIIMDDHAALIGLNDDYIRSVQTSDVRRFDEILAEDFLCSNPDGSLVDRAGFLKQTALPVKISGLQAHDVNVRLMGDFAIIHGRTSYTGLDGRPGAG